MMRIFSLLFLFACVALNFSCAGPSRGTSSGALKVGTGAFSGAYFPTGGALSQVANKYGRDQLTRVISTAGSTQNIKRLIDGGIHIGLSQADRHYEAYYGLGPWKEEGPRSELRSLFSLYPQTINLIASGPSGIKRLEDLRGRRVNLGVVGSGDRINALDLLSLLGLDPNTDLNATEYSIGEAVDRFLEGKLDAFFYTIGHPSLMITEASTYRAGVRFVPLDDVEAFLVKYPYYNTALIPVSSYPNMLNSEEKVESVGIMTTLLTTKYVPEEEVYLFTKAIFEHLEEFKKLHPVLKNLNKASMLEGLSAPLHPGAKRYFEESGLLDALDAEKRLF